jgi:hypothetical protein
MAVVSAKLQNARNGRFDRQSPSATTSAVRTQDLPSDSKLAVHHFSAQQTVERLNKLRLSTETETHYRTCTGNDLHSAHGITGKKVDKCLHFLSIFIARMHTTDLIIRSVPSNMKEKTYYCGYIYTPATSTRLERRAIFCFVSTIPVISSLNKQRCSLRRSFTVLSFRATQTIFAGAQARGGMWAFVPAISSSKQLRSRGRFIVHTFHNTEITLIEFQTPDIFPEF